MQNSNGETVKCLQLRCGYVKLRSQYEIGHLQRERKNERTVYNGVMDVKLAMM